MLKSAPAPIWAVAFSPDGSLLAAGGYRKVQLWSVADRASRGVLGNSDPLGGPPITTPHGLNVLGGAVRSLAWSSDGVWLAGGGGKPGQFGEIHFWNMQHALGQPATVSLGWDSMTLHKDVVEGVAFVPAESPTVVSASDDEKSLVYAFGVRKTVGTMTDHTNRVVSVSVSQNGKYVATGSLDKTVKIWSGTDYKPLANLDQNGGQVYAVAFLPSGDQLAAAGEDGNVRIYRLSESRTGSLVGVNGQVGRTFNGNRTPIFALAVSQKGNLLAASGQDGTVNLYDTNGGRKATLKECPDAVYSLAFSPDGSLLAAGCRDGKIRLWTTADGKLSGELPGQ